MDLLINAIYLATEGEGVLIGSPQVFVRFQGCAIACVNCDSKDTWSFDKESAMSLDQVMSEIHQKSFEGKIKRVSITGGDPLHPMHEQALIELIARLKAKGFWVNLEAAGTRLVDRIFDRLDFISFDYKTPSTGVKTKLSLISKLIEQYQGRAQIKSVVASKEDFEDVLMAREKVLETCKDFDTPWCLTPAYETHEEFPMKRFQEVIALNHEHGAPFRVIGQQHKWIFGADKKLV